jgi:hypothetical protein
MLELTGVGAFVLLIIGTLGLLSTEFIFDWGGAVTLTLASLNVVGLPHFSLYLLAREKRSKRYK